MIRGREDIGGREEMGGEEGGRDVQPGLAGAFHLAIKFKIVFSVICPRESRYVPGDIHLGEARREGGREGGRKGGRE